MYVTKFIRKYNYINRISTEGFFRTKVSRDGLVCFLDAGNSNSYNGGATWTDLSGNGNNGSLVGGITFSTSNSGKFTLDGIAGTYITISTPNLTTSNFTVIGAARYVVASGRIFSGLNNNWLLGWHGTTTENFYSDGWVTASGTGASDTNWRITAGSGDITGDIYRIYVNGIWTPVATIAGGSAGPNGFSLGRYAPGPSEYANCDIGFLLIYNRVLHSYEISEIFQATRARYSL
jgi:hypothetical protein